MNWSNSQANSSSISSLMNNLFAPQQQTWNLGINNIGGNWLYPRGSYPEIFVPTGRNYWDNDFSVIYGFPTPISQVIGSPGSPPVIGGSAGGSESIFGGGRYPIGMPSAFYGFPIGLL
jgi:hypothetical protein